MSTSTSMPGISSEDKLEYAELLQKQKELEVCVLYNNVGDLVN